MTEHSLLYVSMLNVSDLGQNLADKITLKNIEYLLNFDSKQETQSFNENHESDI